MTRIIDNSTTGQRATIKAMAREIPAINHEHKADPIVLPVVDLRNKDYPQTRGNEGQYIFALWHLIRG